MSAQVKICSRPAGGFPPRGGRGGRGSARGGRGAPSTRGGGKETPLKFENDFDFESENAKFNKEQIEKEFKEKLSISEYMACWWEQLAEGIANTIHTHIDAIYKQFPHKQCVW